MKTMLVKRLESSFVAFKSTISKQCKNLEILISMFENGVVYIPAKHFNLFELLENDEDDFLAKVDYFLENEKMKAFDSKDFKDEYLEQLKIDLEILQELVKLWENIDSDPKLDKFKSILDLHKTDKVVVFTESKQTALYLEEQLKEYKQVLTVHGENRDKLKEVIRENFDANYKNKKDDFNVIISTDTLSEGVNMHRSNIIYNYDIPWNSTRLMQRIGRINRIGTKHSEIFIYNFKPTAQSESLIELSKKAFIKLQTFHHAVGEDSQIYSKNEKVGTVSLYEVEVEKADEELKFLEEIRKYKEANPKTFKYLKELPKKVRVQRDIKDLKETSFVFIKNNDSKSYYMVDNQNCEAVNFVKMATQLKTTKDEVAINPIKQFHYSHVKKAIEMYDKEISDIAVQTTNVKVEHKSDKESIGKLKSWIDKDFITTELYEIFIKTIKDGKLQNLSKEIVNIAKKYQSKDIIVKLEELQKKYNLFEKKESPKIVEKKLEIILSETFV